MNGPSLQTALLSAANLLSLGGTIFPRCFLIRSGYSFTAFPTLVKMTPCFCRSFWRLL